jgi:hypothetical protein
VSGGMKATLIIALAVFALACLNIAMWRRMKAAVAAGRAEEARRTGDPLP